MKYHGKGSVLSRDWRKTGLRTSSLGIAGFEMNGFIEECTEREHTNVRRRKYHQLLKISNILIKLSKENLKQTFNHPGRYHHEFKQ